MPYLPVPSYLENAALRKSKRFRTAMDEAIQLRTEIEEREARIAELKLKHIEPALIAADVEGRIDYNGWQVAIIDRKEGMRLDRKQLVVALERRGYDTSVIAEAMVDTPGAHYVELRSPSPATEAEKTETRGEHVTKVVGRKMLQ